MPDTAKALMARKNGKATVKLVKRIALAKILNATSMYPMGAEVWSKLTTYQKDLSEKQQDRKVTPEAQEYWRRYCGLLSIVSWKVGIETTYATLVEVNHELEDDAPSRTTHRLFTPKQDRDGEDVYTQWVVADLNKVHENTTFNITTPLADVVRANPTVTLGNDDFVLGGTTTLQLIEAIKAKAPGRSNTKIQRCISAMTRGGKYTQKWKDGNVERDLLHASKGVAGASDNCTLFWIEPSDDAMEIIGIGYHKTTTSYTVVWSKGNGLGNEVVLG